MVLERATTASPGPPVSRGRLREQVSARILTAAFQGQFRSGQRLVVQHLAELFQVSPTPVRESLVELASLGIVDLLPNRGAVVRAFGPQEVREISQIRRVLEVEAARGACGRIAADELLALERELARLEAMAPSPAWDQAGRAVDTRLHGLIATSCGSNRLAAEIDRYLTLFRTLRDVSHQRNARTNYSHTVDVPEHLAIVRALLESDEEAVARAMDRHIRSAAEVLEEVVFGASEARALLRVVAEDPKPAPEAPDAPP